VSLIGFRAQNHPQQLVRDDVDDRRTPVDLLAECAALAGVDAFDLDVAANAENTKAPRFFAIDDNGLEQPWDAARVWCNPPYSNIPAWVDKAWVESCRREVDVIAMLLPANRTEQSWWQDEIEPHRGGPFLRVHFLRGRRRFDRPGWTKPVKGDRPPFGLCLLVWRTPNPHVPTPPLTVAEVAAGHFGTSPAGPRLTVWNDPSESSW
jgi:phage N-6-adenine-methyltransferase